MRKSWSTRARRWLKMMPASLRERNPWKESTKKAVKTWVKENVGSRGEDHVLWGRWQIAEAHEEGKEQKRRKKTHIKQTDEEMWRAIKEGQKGRLGDGGGT